MSGSHNGALVCLSILIAITAAFTALDLATRARVAVGSARHVWLATAALAMGGGIWAMHFVGMLAFTISGLEVHYDFQLTLMSLLVAIAVTAIAFAAVLRNGSGLTTLLPGGLFMGLGIGAMHYLGMAAMTMHAHLSYHGDWVVVSLAIAIGASTVALWLSARAAGVAVRLIAAVAMGFAISGMHYSAMHGAIFEMVDGTLPVPDSNSFDLFALALAVIASTFLILFLALIAAMYDRRLASMSERETQALRQSEERFRSLYSRTPLPLYQLDGAGRLRYVSESWLELMGFEHEQVIGRRLSEFMTEVSAHKAIHDDWPHLLDTGVIHDAEYQMVTAHGTLIDVLASGRVERDHTGFIVLGGLNNVTERRLAEQALRQAQKLEAIGKLTGGVAHDFNNLLAVVVGNLELLQKRLGGDARARSLIENAVQGAKRGVTLTQRMLAFARKQELRPVPVSLADLLEGMSDLLQRSVGPTVHIEMQVPRDLPNAFVDANQLELVLINLVVNSRDAMPDGGTVRIGAGFVRQAVSSIAPVNHEFICLTVRDNGTGMDADELARATEPFFTTKGIGKGTGLGLSMAQGLAEQSGGRLVLQSEPGQGTTVELWLPVATAQQSVAAKDDALDTAPDSLGPPAPLNILVVDDDSLVLANTAAMLEDLGHVVQLASSAITALALIRAGRSPDLVITDEAMPSMSGSRLAAILETERPTLAVLLVSGFAEFHGGLPDTLPRLAKPFTQVELSRAVNDTVRIKSNSLPIQ
ncbi:response regulator [Halopseudomonas nanhaiensis]|uniref:MHYT domain-containing protein n=1 Tax=Halopseudomonas nanhaiensis TaxID=2830842 RepID=UPI001CC12773|nr:MHYT domain-containing protein [Halopseudomonas nanhaiensis]UAW97546.1 response regulator [Halopseudomonas nanhaiensis]